MLECISKEYNFRVRFGFNLLGIRSGGRLLWTR